MGNTEPRSKYDWWTASLRSFGGSHNYDDLGSENEGIEGKVEVCLIVYEREH